MIRAGHDAVASLSELGEQGLSFMFEAARFGDEISHTSALGGRPDRGRPGDYAGGHGGDRHVKATDQGREVPFVTLQPGYRIYQPCSSSAKCQTPTPNCAVTYRERPRPLSALHPHARRHADRHQRYRWHPCAPALRQPAGSPDQPQARGEQRSGGNAHPIPLRRTRPAIQRSARESLKNNTFVVDAITGRPL